MDRNGILRTAVEADKNRIKELLERNISECIYLYIDFINDGVKNIWIEEDGEGNICSICLKYHDSFQVFCTDYFWNAEEIAELLRQENVSMISAKKTVIDRLSEYLPNYRATYGSVFKMIPPRTGQNTIFPELATEEDMEEIARLICSDPVFGSYCNVSDLKKQFCERLEKKQGRNLIIRDKGRIIAHTATYAENERLAVVSGTIIKEEYRNRGYYSALSSAMIDMLTKEGKEIYTFATSERVINHHRIMYEECGEYGRLISD